jgi:hypothetical protein
VSIGSNAIGERAIAATTTTSPTTSNGKPPQRRRITAKADVVQQPEAR